MKRLLIAAVVVTAALVAVPAAPAEPGGGAFQAQCTNFPGPFPGTTGGQIIITPAGNINANCRFPGPAEGGGAGQLPGTGCVIAPAGNFDCHPPQGP